MARPGEPTTSPRRLKARLRQAEALQLRLAGHEYEEIAVDLGYASRSGAFHAVEAALNHGLRGSVAEELLLNLRRLDRLLFACWHRAIGLSPDGSEMPPDLQASGEVRAILAERAKLLGLYPAPGSRRQERLDEDLLRKEAERVARATGSSVEEIMAEARGIFEEDKRRRQVGRDVLWQRLADLDSVRDTLDAPQARRLVLAQARRAFLGQNDSMAYLAIVALADGGTTPGRLGRPQLPP